MEHKVSEAEKIFNESIKQGFTFEEKTKIQFRPTERGSKEPLRLIGPVTSQKPGFVFIQNESYTDFFPSWRLLPLAPRRVQIGTAYLLCPEAKITAAYRQALRDGKDNETVVTNVFTGRPARGIVNRFVREIGPMSDVVPEFPLAAAALAPLRSKSEMAGSGDFTPLWSGQAARLSRELPAAELTRRLAAETLEAFRMLRCRRTLDELAMKYDLRALADSSRFARGSSVGKSWHITKRNAVSEGCFVALKFPAIFCRP